MRKLTIILPVIAGVAIAGCAKKDDVAAVPPPPPGAIAGTTAADRNGDGIIDGYYTSDGIYVPNYVEPAPQPAVYRASRRGERG